MLSASEASGQRSMSVSHYVPIICRPDSSASPQNDTHRLNCDKALDLFDIGSETYMI